MPLRNKRSIFKNPSNQSIFPDGTNDPTRPEEITESSFNSVGAEPDLYCKFVRRLWNNLAVFAEGARRNAKARFEPPLKMTLVGEAHLGRDLGER